MQVKTAGIDISSIREIDPLSSSEENCCNDVMRFPDTFTTYTTTHTLDVTPASDSEDVEPKVKRRRVQELSADVIRQQNNILACLTALEATRQESQNRQNELLEAVASAVDRHAAATARLADVHARAFTRILNALEKQKGDS